MEISPEQELKIQKEIAEKTAIYITYLLSPTNNPKNPDVGSGTFVTIQGKYGILTNAHVARNLIIDKNRNYISIPDIPQADSSISQSINIQCIKILSLPETTPETTFGDIDMAFIHLTDESYNKVKQIKKQFWNLDDSALEWRKNNWQNIEKSFWVIHGAVAEGSKHHRYNNTEYIDFKNGRPYIVVPDLETIKEDRFKCKIKTDNNTPKSFAGMSGGAIWQLIHNEKFEILDILLRGIATKYKPGAKRAESIICHGPSMIYEKFYPYCVDCLNNGKPNFHLAKYLVS